MKEICAYLISLVVTALLVAIMGVPLPYTVATLVGYVLVNLLVVAAIKHITEKKMPTIMEWVVYACILVAIILLSAGLIYRSVYCLLFAILFLVVCAIIEIVEKKKAKKAE